MNYNDRTKDELIRELAELQKEFNEVREKYTREISQLRLAEEELVKSEEKFRKAFVTSPDSININRLEDGLYVSINKGFTKIMGYSEGDVIGKTSIELNIWKDPGDRKRLIEGLNAKGEVENLEAAYISKSGEILYGMMSAAIINLAGVPHILSITRDITDRKLAAIALQESESRYRELIELAVDGILLGSSDGIVIGANTCILNLTGRKSDQLIGKHISCLFDPDEISMIPLRFDLLKRGDVVILERNILRPDGSKVPVEMHTKMMPDGSYQSIIHDIAVRKKTNEAMKIAIEKAEASDRIKTSFLNNISHEVRTPLNGIIGFAEIISKDFIDPAERENALSIVNECSERLLDTITNYMDISLLVSGEMSICNSEFILRDLLIKVIEKYETPCSSKNLKFRIDIDDLPEDAIMNSDPDLIIKAISHLLNNAIKFTEKGSIIFSCKVAEGELQFAVTDTGIGISEEAINNVFNYFFKEERIKSRPSEGSGLGLTIARGLIELLGGTLSVKSEKGKGTSFYFTLPPINPLSGKRIRSWKGRGSLNKKLSSILVAEDDEASFLLISTLLGQSTKAEVIRAANGREAVEKFNLNRGVDIILMDMKMPEMDGFEATRIIKSIDPYIPVIAITAYAMLGDEKRILDAGCDEYLSKPIAKNILIGKISRFINV
jgi:PAS domain S-box-containing protein